MATMFVKTWTKDTVKRTPDMFDTFDMPKFKISNTEVCTN